VDIQSWQTAAWGQAKKEYSLRGIPALCVYDGKGVYVNKVVGGNLAELDKLVKKAQGS